MFTTTSPTQVDLRSLNRCRNAWSLIFFSDMVSANGRETERCFLSPPLHGALAQSDFTFAKEQPTSRDWNTWSIFWMQSALPGLYLHQLLSSWIEPTHRHWEWFLSENDKIVEKHINGGITYYHPVARLYT